MGKAAEITIDVKAKLDVDRKTAETCLLLIETYCNTNNLRIRTETNDEGIALMFVSEGGNTWYG